MWNRVMALVSVIALVAVIGCGEKVVRSKTASAGGWTAYATDRPGFDGPYQFLYLRDPAGKVEKVEDLAPDSETCSDIVWSPTGQRVAFIIRSATGSRLSVVDVTSYNGVWRPELTAGQTASSRIERLEFQQGDRVIAFDACRPDGSCDRRTVVHEWP